MTINSHHYCYCYFYPITKIYFFSVSPFRFTFVYRKRSISTTFCVNDRPDFVRFDSILPKRRACCLIIVFFFIFTLIKSRFRLETTVVYNSETPIDDVINFAWFNFVLSVSMRVCARVIDCSTNKAIVLLTIRRRVHKVQVYNT